MSLEKLAPDGSHEDRSPQASMVGPLRNDLLKRPGGTFDPVPQVSFSSNNGRGLLPPPPLLLLLLLLLRPLVILSHFMMPLKPCYFWFYHSEFPFDHRR